MQRFGPRRPFRRPKTFQNSSFRAPPPSPKAQKPCKIQGFGPHRPIRRPKTSQNTALRCSAAPYEDAKTLHNTWCCPLPGPSPKAQTHRKMQVWSPDEGPTHRKMQSLPPPARSEGAKALQNTWLPRGPVRSPIAIAQSWSQLRGTTAIATVDDAYTGGRRQWRSR